MKGKVIGIGEIESNMLKVEILRSEACGKCKGCISGHMEKEMELDVRNLCNAEIGDWVELELQDNAFFNAVMYGYGVPLLCFIGGILIGHFALTPLFLNVTEGLVSFCGGVVGVLAGYGWIKSKNDKWNTGNYTPLATRLADEDLFA